MAFQKIDDYEVELDAWARDPNAVMRASASRRLQVARYKEERDAAEGAASGAPPAPGPEPIFRQDSNLDALLTQGPSIYATLSASGRMTLARYAESKKAHAEWLARSQAFQAHKAKRVTSMS